MLKKILIFCLFLAIASCHKDNPVSPAGGDHQPNKTIWTTKIHMSVARGVMGAGVFNGTIYAIGGSLDAYTSTSVVEAYDTTTDSWTKKADIPQELCLTTACIVNGKIYVTILNACGIYLLLLLFSLK